MAEARAILRYVRIAPRKARLVVDLIRGQQVAHALTVLKYSPRGASKVVSPPRYPQLSGISVGFGFIPFLEIVTKKRFGGFGGDLRSFVSGCEIVGFKQQGCFK